MKSPKLFICSDIHGSARFCSLMLDAFDRERADALIILGDVLYHGPRNALPMEYDAPRVIAMLNERKNDIICVRGNCDSEVDQLVLEFPIMSDTSTIFVDGKKLFLTHGHKYGPQNLPPIGVCDTLLFGHTHVPTDVTVDGVRCVNPGSVSIPKGGSSNSYMIYENESFTWKTLDGSIFNP